MKPDTTTTAIVKRASVEEMVGHRDRAIQQFTTAVAMLDGAAAAWARACDSNGSIMNTYQFKPRSHDPEQFRKELDCDVWKRLLNMTQLRDLMDVTARANFDDQCRTDPPPVTVDNVLATLADLMSSAHDIFLRSVVATFEALPRSYRSNDGFKYGQRIILDHAIDVNSYRSGAELKVWWTMRSSSYAAERIHDLDRVFHVLDDKPVPTRANGAVVTIEEAVRRNQPFEIKTAYFRVKGYAKGTLHLWPLRQDLAVKANRLLAAHYGWALGHS